MIKQIKLQKENTVPKRCDECHRLFNLNDGEKHYYDAQLDIYLCSNRCLINSFMPQLGDDFAKFILQNPEYNVVDVSKKAGVTNGWKF